MLPTSATGARRLPNRFSNLNIKAVSLAVHLACASPLLLAPMLSAQAQNSPGGGNLVQVDLPAGPLSDVLGRFAQQAGVPISIETGKLKGLQSAGLHGAYRIDDGFEALLRGSGYAVSKTDAGYVLVPATGLPSAASDAGLVLPTVTINASAEVQAGALPAPYAGGQVAKGGKLGLLGNKDVMDTPFNTVAYTSQLILDQQARTITDVLNNNPSVRLIYPDNDSSTDLIVRGNKIASLDMAYDGLYGIGNVGIDSLERVEFLTGANALLNGLGAIGGAGGMVNQVPKRALDTPLTRLTGTYVSNSQFGGQIDISRRFGDNNQFGVRFNGSYSDGNAPTTYQSKELGSFTMALDYRGDGLRLSTDFGQRHNDAGSPSRTTIVVAGYAVPPPPSNATATWQQPWSYDITDTTFGAARAEYDIAPALTVYAAFGGSRFTEREYFFNTQLRNAKGDIYQQAVYWPVYRNSVSAETGARGEFSAGPVKNNWNLSASALRNTSGIVQTRFAIVSSNIYNPVYVAAPDISALAGPAGIPKTGAATMSGVALADTLGFLDDRIQWTLGVREQNVETASFDATSGKQTANYSKSVATYATGLVIKPMPNLSWYANYIEGLQPGPVAPVGTTNAGTIFSPYVSKQYETGIKYDFGTFLTTLSVYQLSTPNGQTNTSTLTYAVDGEQKTKGVEINTMGEVVSGVRVLGGVALVNAVQTHTAGGTNDGKKVTGAADVTLNLGMEWDPGFLQGLTLSGRAIYTDKQYADSANLQSIPSSVRYDVGARYKTTFSGHPTTFRLGVENLFNKSYWSEANLGYLVQSRPRTFLMSVSVDM